MQTKAQTPAQPPIIEPWRVGALILVVLAGMLFVHAIEPAGAGSLAGPAAVAAPR